MKHFKEEQWNFTHRCPVFGPMTFDWSTLDYIVKRWNTRSKACPKEPSTTSNSFLMSQIQNFKACHAGYSHVMEIDAVVDELTLDWDRSSFEAFAVNGQLHISEEDEMDEISGQEQPRRVLPGGHRRHSQEVPGAWP